VLPPSRKFLHLETCQLGLHSRQSVHQGRIRMTSRWRWLVRFALPRQPRKQTKPRLVACVCQPEAKA
jgi:hypothetical protein